MGSTKPRTLKTVETTCSVLTVLKESNGTTVTELANQLGISKGAAYNHLATLREENFVVQDGNTYRIGYRFHNFGTTVKHQSVLYRAGRSEVDRLEDATGESVNLMTEEFGKGIYLYKKKGREGIAGEFHDALLQDTDYLHWSSTGKAILAQYDEERVRRIIDEHGLPSATEHTITDEQELFEDLAKVRDRGNVALSDEEQVRGIRAIGAPVMDGNDEVLGAISISGPTSRITDEKFREEYPNLVSQSANIIEVAVETKNLDV